MKKFLSMVLALVMAVSLVTISSSAAFTDAADIDYKEAVDVMTAVGIVDGYEDGSFGPDGYLSRGAAAKIICNMILGVNNNLPSSAAPYSDVPAGSTFAGYIAYCQNEGIVSGYTDGTFKPGNQLTGFAFMKMLLGALGYDSDIEVYTGNNWAVSVAKDGKAAGLYTGFPEDINFNGAITRQEALQMAFNAMKATMVSYPSNTAIVVGDIKVTTTAEAKKVETASTTSYNAKDDGYVQFCEANFANLKVDTTAEDSYGRPANKWTNKTTAIGTYAKKATKTYTVAPTLYELRKDLGLKASETPSFYVTWDMHNAAWSASGDWYEFAEQEYILYPAVSSDEYTLGETIYGSYQWANEQAGTNVGATFEGWYDYFTSKDNNYYWCDWYPIYGKGQQIEVYYDKTGATQNEIIVIDETFGKINAVKKDDNGRYVTVEGSRSGAKFYTENFAKGDYVVYTTGANATNDIVSMTAAEKRSGTVNFINAATYMVIDGTGYFCHAGDWVTNYGVTAGDEVDFWLDTNGYIVNIVVTDSNSDPSKLVMITKKGTADLLGDKKAIAIYGDGKEEVVTLYDADETNLYDIYSYVTSNGKLKVNAPSGFYQEDVTEAFYYVKGATSFGGIDVDANTQFVYIDAVGTVKSIKTYVGYKNAPSIGASDDLAATMAYALYKDNADAASLVYVWADSEKLSSTAANYTIVVPDTYYKWTAIDADGVLQYYYALRLVDGSYLYIDAAAADDNIYVNDIEGVKDTAAAVVYDTIVYNTDNGYVDSASNSEADRVIAGTAGTNAVKYKNGVLYVDGTGYGLTDDAVCYVVSYNGDTVVEDDITALDGEFLNYTIILNDELGDGGEIQTLILREVKG